MLALKLAAAAALVAAGTAMGLRWANTLAARCLALQDALLLLRLVQVRMQGACGLWLTQLAAVASDGGFAVLRLAPDIPEEAELRGTLQRWLQAAGAPELLGREACGWLLCALECAATRQETAARLDYYQQLLEEALLAARARQARDQRLCLQLGPLAGMLLAVILW